MLVLGLDACRKGWVGVLVRDGTVVDGVFATALGELDLDGVDGVGIDIPLGLATDRMRAADAAARRALGPRRASVFATPVRAALEASTHREASATNRAITGTGISIQAWGLRSKVLEADAWVVSSPGPPVWEVHPELAFSVLRGDDPCAHPKTTWAGAQERRAALAAAGLDLNAVPATVGALAGADDVLDAAAVAWSAGRLVRGVGRSWPDEPERYPGWGQPVAIWA